MKYFSILFLIFLSINLSAQEDYSIAASGKTIEFHNIGKLTIVGTSDSNMSLERAGDRKIDEKAKGLRKISASGRQDNTGFGVSVTETAGTIIVEQVGNASDRITVKVPNNSIVKFEAVGHQGGKLNVEDFSGELDVSMQYHPVYLKNVTGPAAVNTIYGNITMVLSSQPTNDVQLFSSYQDVDLSLPANAKVDVKLNTSYGSMYTDFDLKVPANTGKDHNNSGLEGEINGGGPSISITATYEDIYLRKGK